MRGWAWGLLALLLAAPAFAQGPAWDRYQVILWQERTPAQSAGLAALGFTGAKLRATGGRVDPADLAARRAAGLPYYLENIATDFYAPYHRFVPGRAVTWLFDAAKARRRAAPLDDAPFVREPSLSDPLWLAAVSERLSALVAAHRGDRPLFYNLADEPGIGDLAAAWDADVSPPSLAGFRLWLRTVYPSLEALNRQWGTEFAGWDAVVPELTDAAMRRGDDNFSAWADFKAWMDAAFARAVRAGTDALHRADPAALSAIEGAQLPGWGGYDYALLAGAVDVMEVDGAGDALDLARAFNPALRPLRTAFGRGPRERHAAWRHALHGGRGLVVWDEADDVVAPDGTPGPRGREIASLAAEIGAVFPLLAASRPSHDPVAILHSQAGFRTRWMLDHRHLGPAWIERDAEREWEDNAWRAARRVAVERLGQLGVVPRFISSAQVEAGMLRGGGLRVLVLPHAIALSDAEAAEVAAFAAAGGTVLADVEPGLFDQHSRRRPHPPQTGALLLEALRNGGAPDGPEGLAALAEVLRRAGAPPRAALEGPDGAAAVGVEMRWLATADGPVLALQAMRPWGAPPEVVLRLPRAMAITDLRRGGPALRGDRLAVPLDPVAPTLLRLGP